ncbi:hypothetical protein [Haladaptatus salinisoli]|nr:hypothetical protein [Haladaptatus salinisoli]
MTADGRAVPSGMVAISSRWIGTSTTSENTFPARKTKSRQLIVSPEAA